MPAGDFDINRILTSTSDYGSSTSMTYCASCTTYYPYYQPHTCAPAVAIMTNPRLTVDEIDAIARRVIELLDERKAKKRAT